MMKRLFIIPLIALMAAACTKEDISVSGHENIPMRLYSNAVDSETSSSAGSAVFLFWDFGDIINNTAYPVPLVVCYPFDRGRRTVHELSRILVRIFFVSPLRWRQRVEGRELIDRRKRYVIVINHNTVIDIPTLYYIPLNFRWVSKREVFRVPFFGQYLVLHGDICIDRGRAAEALEQMVRKGKMWIGRGASIAIFPEGTRSKDGEIHRFKAGAFTLAREAGVDILPVVLDGTRTLIRKNLLFNWGNRITIRVLPPVPAERVAAEDPHELMTEVHDAMCAALADIRKQR